MKARGFTLIEVMIAMLVIALSVGALLSTLVTSASAVDYLREKAFAQWIALNRVSELRLSGARPASGVTRDTVEFGGQNWRWEQQVSDAGIEGLLRVDVRVSRLPDGATATAADEVDDAPAVLGSAIGFIGTALARPSGITPDWSPRAAPGGSGGGGDDDDREDKQ